MMSAKTELVPSSGTYRIDVARDRLDGEASAATPSRILVVDDDDGARVLLEQLFLDAGFIVTTVPDAKSALAEVRRGGPDLVVTDLQMPLVQGVELCRRLRELDRELPVIVMSAHSDMQSVLDSLRAGAEDYLIKPLELDAVLWCVQRTLARRADKSAHQELYRKLNERLVLSSVREQEHAEAEARQRTHLNMLLENLNEGVIVGDADGHLLMRNRAAHDIFGLVSAEASAIAPSSLDAFDPDGRPLRNDERPLERATRGESFTDYELLYVLASGERRCIVFTGTSVKDDSGKVAMAIVVFRDVTEVRRLEQQRREYLALISHDLRGPLGTILMSVSRLKSLMSHADAPSGVTVAERAERNVKRMTAMLEDLSEATSLEMHGGDLRRITCDLSELVAGIVDDMDGAAARRITIELENAPPFLVFVDRSRLERAIVNLLTNALKYSAGDSPVQARLAHDEHTVRIDVIDRGIGIAPDQREMLFNRYYRTEAGKALAGGSGLGLYIVRLIAEAHGGHIEVSSEVGEGSTFSLVLPSQEPELEAPCSFKS